MCTIELMKECAQHGLHEEAKAIILDNPLPACADKEERDEYQNYRTVLKIDAPCQTEECSVILKTEVETTPDTPHCFCVYHPNEQDHSSRQCQEKKSPLDIEKAWDLCAKERICISCLTRGHEIRECQSETPSPSCPNCKKNHAKEFPCRPEPEEIYEWFCAFHPDASDHRTPECQKWNEGNTRNAEENRCNWETLRKSFSCIGCLLRGHSAYDCPSMPPRCTECQITHAAVLLCPPPQPKFNATGLSRPTNRKSKSSHNQRRRN